MEHIKAVYEDLSVLLCLADYLQNLCKERVVIVTLWLGRYIRRTSRNPTSFASFLLVFSTALALNCSTMSLTLFFPSSSQRDLQYSTNILKESSAKTRVAAEWIRSYVM